MAHYILNTHGNDVFLDAYSPTGKLHNLMLECFKEKDILFGTNNFYDSPETSAVSGTLSAKKQVQGFHDLQGHRLNGQPQKGIYIHDGKKKLAK